MRAAYIAGSVLCAVLLAGTSGSHAGKLSEDPDAPWIPGLPIANSFAGVLDLDSTPSGAEATTSLGSGCRTPCSLEVTAEGVETEAELKYLREQNCDRAQGWYFGKPVPSSELSEILSHPTSYAKH